MAIFLALWVKEAFEVVSTGTPPLTRFFGPGKNRAKGKPRYRSILVLKPQNGEFEGSKSTFSQVCI